MKKIAFVILFLFGFLAMTCGGGSSSSSSIGFYEKTEEVVPKITPPASESISGILKATWSSGSNLYEVYQLIREYQYPSDEGVVDGSNMHKSMYEAQANVDFAIFNCAGTINEDESVTPSEHLITAQSIISPFDFGDDNLDQTYDCAFTVNETSTPISGGEVNYTKSMAVRQSGTAYYMTMGWYSVASDANSPAAMQVEYDTGANTITVNYAYLVNYNTGNKYAVRIYVNGDISTHLFNMKLLKGGLAGELENYISIAGHGYSEGAGNYYLFRLTMSGIGDATNKYYCFESDTTQEEMQAMDDSGSETIPTECADLELGLPNNYEASSSDVPMLTDVFTGTGDSHTELTWTE